MTMLRQHRLGMELHADDGQIAMGQRHDHAVVAACGDLEIRGQGFFLDDQRSARTR